jgi:hypothetical protein
MTSHEVAQADALLIENAELRRALDVAMAENNGWRDFAKAAQQREQLLQAQCDDARKATTEFDRLRLLACQEVERMAPLVRESYKLQADTIFLRAELDGTKERETALRAKILEWEDAYDRLEGAFDLRLAIDECHAALSDYAGVFYDVVLGELLARAERAEADALALKEALEYRHTCENCGGKGSYWTDVGGEAEHEVCDCWIRADHVVHHEEHPGAALLSELDAARAVIKQSRLCGVDGGCTDEQARQWLATLVAYDAARKVRAE